MACTVSLIQYMVIANKRKKERKGYRGRGGEKKNKERKDIFAYEIQHIENMLMKPRL